MAIQIALNEEQTGLGVPAPNAYCRIVLYTEYIKIDTFQIVVEFYFDNAARQANRRPLKEEAYQLLGAELSGNGNIKKQLYEWLATRPEFVSGVEV